MPKLKAETVRPLPLEKIDEPVNPDRISIDPESVKELAESIKDLGLLTPILVRPVGDRFEIVYGHRRFLAHRLLGLQAINAHVRDLSDADTAVIRATENIQSENLTTIEEAQIYKRLRDKCGLSWEDISRRMGKTVGIIRRRYDLLRMPPMLQDALQARKIVAAVAEELWPITDLGSLSYYLSFAVENGCTRDIARNWCKEWKDAQRRQSDAGGEGGGEVSPFQPRPYYMACDLCQSAVELGKETTMRICEVCHGTIKSNM